MQQSKYLAQALQAMGAGPAAQSPSIDLASMQKAAQEREQWATANPGQSYMMHNLGQAGDALMQAPGAAMQGLSRLGSMFGHGRK